MRIDDVEVINPDHILCTLTDDVPLNIEMTVENGRGYRPAAEGHTEDLEIGAIPIDAIFTPVIRVEYKVQDTRVGQRTNYDQLTLRIWTTGTISPEMALVEAAKILRKHLNPFVQYYEPGPGLPADGTGGWDANASSAAASMCSISFARMKGSNSRSWASQYLQPKDGLALAFLHW